MPERTEQLLGEIRDQLKTLNDKYDAVLSNQKAFDERWSAQMAERKKADFLRTVLTGLFAGLLAMWFLYIAYTH